MSAAEPLIQPKISHEQSRAHSILLALSGPLSLLLIVIGFFWKLVLTSQYSWLESPDIANQVVPWLNFQAQQYHLGHFPMWDPFLFGGQSLIGQAQPGVAYPLNWLLFSLPLHNGRISFDILNWYYLTIHYLAALFCYLLCRDLGRGRIASVLAGVAFGLGGYVANTDWPQMINGAIWAPLVFLFLFRVARGVRPWNSAAFCGLFLGMSWLSGHHQVPIFLTLASVGVWIYVLFEEGRLKRFLLAPAAIFLVFFLFASAFQTWPAYEYGRLAVRWAGTQHDPIAWNEKVPYTVHQQYSISPIFLLGVLIPGYAAETNPYVGVVGLALAAIALACWWKTKEVRVLCAIGIGGLFISIARNDVFHGILYSIVPFVEKARSPATAIFLFQFAVAALTAFGIDALLLPQHRSVIRRAAILLAGFGGLIFLIVFAIDLGRALNWGFDDRVMIVPLVALALAGLIYRSTRGGSLRWASILIVGLYMMEQGNLTFYWLPTKDDKNLSRFVKAYDDTKDVDTFLKRQPGLVRADVSREAVDFNFGDWFGIDTMTGILPSLPASLNNLEFGSERTRMLYATNYAVGRKPTMGGQQEIFHDNTGLIVYKNPGALPRIWTVHDAVRVKDPGDAKRRMQDSAFDLRKTTFAYAAPPAMDHCDGDNVRSFVRDTNSATAIVEMKCRGIVVEAENDAPGWLARIDGESAPVYEAYTSLRGVVVGAGIHTVEMRYRPASVIGGAVCTFAAFLCGFALLLIPRFRRRS